jgi:hypothetical protein
MTHTAQPATLIRRFSLAEEPGLLRQFKDMNRIRPKFDFRRSANDPFVPSRTDEQTNDLCIVYSTFSLPPSPNPT